MGDDSFEALAGSLLAMCDFDRPQAGKLFLDPRTGLRLATGAAMLRDLWMTAMRL